MSWDSTEWKPGSIPGVMLKRLPDVLRESPHNLKTKIRFRLGGSIIKKAQP